MDKLKQTVEDYQFQEELAKTYFSTFPSKENIYTASAPAPKPDNTKTKKILFGVTAGIILIFIAAFFIIQKNGSIQLSSSDEKTDLPVSAADAGKAYLDKEGGINKDLLDNVIFYEGADSQSKWENGFVSLVNEKGAPHAAFGIDFKKPQDLGDNLFYFSAKGKSDGTILRIGIRDNKSSVCYATLGNMSDSWQRFAIDLLAQGEIFINTGAVTHIDFEISPDKNRDSLTSSVYFKDMYLMKRRK